MHVNTEIAENVDTDRRSSGRRPPRLEVLVWYTPKRFVKGCVVDESECGIGIVLEADESPEIGFQICVDDGHERRIASIKHIDNSGGKLRVGLSWEDYFPIHQR